MKRSAKSTRPTGGDCYSRAAELLIKLPRQESELAKALSDKDIKWLPTSVRLAHGLATAQGKIAGVLHGHAWIEVEDFNTGDVFVVDFSNGNRVIMPRETYYAIGKIDDVMLYTREAAARHLAAHKHYGPWDE